VVEVVPPSVGGGVVSWQADINVVNAARDRAIAPLNFLLDFFTWETLLTNHFVPIILGIKLYLPSVSTEKYLLQ
jgi:hypothetical protein